MATDEETQKAVEETRDRRRKVFNATVKKLKSDSSEKSESKQAGTSKDG